AFATTVVPSGKPLIAARHRSATSSSSPYRSSWSRKRFPKQTARGRTRRITSGSAASSTSRSPSSASPAASRVDAIPERRLAPERLCASRKRGRRISAAMAAVVVFPFVAEIAAVPAGRRAASRSIAPGSSVANSFPGTVVPPPAPARRESPATKRAAATSSPSGTFTRANLAVRGFTCGLSNLIYHYCHDRASSPRRRSRRRPGKVGSAWPARPPSLSRGGADRPAQARRVPGGHPQAVHGRSDRRRAAGLRGTAGPLPDDAGVRRRPRDDRPSADGDRALRLLERGQARGRARAAPVRDPRGAARPAPRARRRARPAADGARHRRAQGEASLEVAVLAHVRLADERAPGGRLRRTGGGGTAGASGRAGGGDGAAARTPAAVRRLGRGAQGGRLAPHRVAGLPAARRATRRMVDVPVPRPRAARVARLHRRPRRDRQEEEKAVGVALRGSERGEPLEAGDAFPRCAHGRQRLARLLEAGIRVEALVPHDLRTADGEERSVLQLSLAQANVRVLLDHLERHACGGEEDLVLAGA